MPQHFLPKMTSQHMLCLRLLNQQMHCVKITYSAKGFVWKKYLLSKMERLCVEEILAQQNVLWGDLKPD